MALPNFDAAIATLYSAFIDAVGGEIDNALTVVLLSAEATTYSDATTNLGSGSGKRLGSVTVSASDFALSGSGWTRKCAFLGKAGGTIVAGTAQDPAVIAFLDGSTILHQVAENGVVTFTTGDSFTVSAFDVFKQTAIS